MDEYPRCATCKHWNEKSAWESLDGKNVSICNALAEEDSSEGMGMISTSGGEYTVSTREDFGCILHTPGEN